MGFLTLEEIEFNFIDQRNRELWEKLRRVYQINVSNHHNVYRLEFLPGSDEVFIETTQEYSPAFFAHELLHLNLRHKGLDLFECFKYTDDDSIEVLIYTISNCIDHVLFFNEFVEMGYNKEDFIMDYNNHPFGISPLRQQYEQLYDTNDPEIRDLFISFCYWILKSGVYIGEDRQKELDALSNEFPIRYQDMEKMFSEVMNFTFDSKTVQEDFDKLVSKYINYNSFY